MPKRILIIDGHPDSRAVRYVHALSKAYYDGAHLGGHEVRSIVVSEIDFPLLRTSTELPERRAARNDPGVSGMVEDMSEAQRGEWLARVQELGVRGH
jgi:putative NADPH-quinone reductase